LLVVLAVKQFDVDVRIQLAQQPQLAVLGRDQRLLHGRQLDVKIVLGQIEIGREHLGHASLVPRDRKSDRLVHPTNAVVVQEAREFLLGGMCKTDSRMRRPRTPEQARPLLDRSPPARWEVGCDGGRQVAAPDCTLAPSHPPDPSACFAGIPATLSNAPGAWSTSSCEAAASRTRGCCRRWPRSRARTSFRTISSAPPTRIPPSPSATARPFPSHWSSPR